MPHKLAIHACAMPQRSMHIHCAHLAEPGMSAPGQWQKHQRARDSAANTWPTAPCHFLDHHHPCIFICLPIAQAWHGECRATTGGFIALFHGACIDAELVLFQTIHNRTCGYILALFVMGVWRALVPGLRLCSRDRFPYFDVPCHAVNRTNVNLRDHVLSAVTLPGFTNQVKVRGTHSVRGH